MNRLGKPYCDVARASIEDAVKSRIDGALGTLLPPRRSRLQSNRWPTALAGPSQHRNLSSEFQIYTQFAK